MSRKPHKGRRRHRSKFPVQLSTAKTFGEGVDLWPKPVPEALRELLLYFPPLRPDDDLPQWLLKWWPPEVGLQSGKEPLGIWSFQQLAVASVPSLRVLHQENNPLVQEILNRINDDRIREVPFEELQELLRSCPKTALSFYPVQQTLGRFYELAWLPSSPEPPHRPALRHRWPQEPQHHADQNLTEAVRFRRFAVDTS